MDLQNIATTLTALKTVLTALRLPSTFDSATPLAFNSVEIFDLQDLRLAMEELFIYGHRICVIVLEGVEHENNVQGQTLTTTRTLDISLIFTDRRYDSRQKALMGDSAADPKTPGVLYLQKLIVDAISGELSTRDMCLPESGELILIEAKDRTDLTGRLVFRQSLSLNLGTDRATRASRFSRTGNA